MTSLLTRSLAAVETYVTVRIQKNPWKDKTLEAKKIEVESLIQRIKDAGTFADIIPEDYEINIDENNMVSIDPV